VYFWRPDYPVRAVTVMGMARLLYPSTPSAVCLVREALMPRPPRLLDRVRSALFRARLRVLECCRPRAQDVAAFGARSAKRRCELLPPIRSGADGRNAHRYRDNMGSEAL